MVGKTNRREVLSTDTVVPRRRLAFWNDAASSSLTEQSCVPLNPQTFSGRMIRADIGDLRFVEFNSDAGTVRRSRAHIAHSGGPHYLIRFQLGAESVFSQGGEDVRLRPGDFALCDSTRPYQLSFDQPVSILTVRVSRTVLRRYLGTPEDLVNITVCGSSGCGSLAARVIREIWQSSDEALAPRC